VEVMGMMSLSGSLGLSADGRYEQCGDGDSAKEGAELDSGLHGRSPDSHFPFFLSRSHFPIRVPF
jgi:hypothetical protein